MWMENTCRRKARLFLLIIIWIQYGDLMKHNCNQGINFTRFEMVVCTWLFTAERVGLKMLIQEALSLSQEAQS